VESSIAVPNGSTAKAWQHLVVEMEAEGVAVVTLARPPANALNRQLMDELRAVAEQFSGPEPPRAVILNSAVPGIFMAGADLKMLDVGWDQMTATTRKFQDAGNAWERIPAPTIAAIGGHAAGGGCEIALCCDFRIMTRGPATIGLPEVRWGLLPAGGGTQRLARLVGRGAALDLVLRGRMIPAAEAEQLGLVTETCEPADLEARARVLAGELAVLPPLAVREIKRCILEGLEGHLAAGLALEERGVVALSRTADTREGVNSFVERRKPVFRGR
jgi:enoyl-CoA hydratase/carnithine racemase